MDVQKLAHHRPTAEKWGLSLEALALAGRLAGAVRRRELPLPVLDGDELPHWQRLRAIAQMWNASPSGQKFIGEVMQAWISHEREATPSWRRVIARAHPSEIVDHCYSLPRLTRTHLWIDPPMGFPETHWVLFLCWNMLLPDPLEEARVYFAQALAGQLLQEGMCTAFVNDPLVCGLTLVADADPQSENEGIRLILSELLKVARPNIGRYVPDDEFEEARRDVATDYVIKELPKLKDLEFMEVLSKGFRGEIASRHGFRCDILNLIDKQRRPTQWLLRETDRIEDLCETPGIKVEMGSFTPPAWLQELRQLDYLSLGHALDKNDEKLRSVLGRQWARILWAYFERPTASQKEIAVDVGCGLSTVERACRAFREHEDLLRAALGLRKRGPH